jgi:carbohydrate kinase (thermoresistant glucokinase family)
VGDALRGNSCVVIGCSALKKSYREIIRNAARREVVFLHCAGARSVIEARMAAREGHFMPVSLLDSQYGALQPLEPEEVGITVDIDQPFLVVVATFLREIKERDYG